MRQAMPTWWKDWMDVSKRASQVEGLWRICLRSCFSVLPKVATINKNSLPRNKTTVVFYSSICPCEWQVSRDGSWCLKHGDEHVYIHFQRLWEAGAPHRTHYGIRAMPCVDVVLSGQIWGRLSRVPRTVLPDAWPWRGAAIWGAGLPA